MNNEECGAGRDDLDVDPRDVDPRDIDPRNGTPDGPWESTGSGGVRRGPKVKREQKPRTTVPPVAQIIKPRQDSAAFDILPTDCWVRLDANFVRALSDFILENNPVNRAITAFGHQLRNAVD
jgi:hypothetical protein